MHNSDIVLGIIVYFFNHHHHLSYRAVAIPPYVQQPLPNPMNICSAGSGLRRIRCRQGEIAHACIAKDIADSANY